MTVSLIFDYGLFVTGRAGFRAVAKLSSCLDSLMLDSWGADQAGTLASQLYSDMRLVLTKGNQ